MVVFQPLVIEASMIFLSFAIDVYLFVI